VVEAVPNTAMASFLDDLTERCPWIGPILNEHVADNGEMLPHVLMGRITHASADHSDSDLAVFLAILERGLGAYSATVGDVIGASFVENLYGEEAFLSRIRTLAGPLLSAELLRAGVLPE
jgi:hypothetical protein